MKYLPIFILLLISCAAKQPRSATAEKANLYETFLPLASINIIDRNGFTETITAPDRLKRYERTEFLGQQPFQKVLRVFQRDKNGHVRAIITTYHQNGELKQYLEVVDGRAHGTYVEWHPNGKRKLQTFISEGTADIDEMSQLTWNFHGISKAWDEDGTLKAEINYDKGILSGDSVYYHNNGARSKILPYHKGKISGTVMEWYADGLLLLQEEYIEGIKDGHAVGYWPDRTVAFEEQYTKDLLMEGKYYDRSGTLVCSIIEGNGTKCLFDAEGPKELHDFTGGKPEGKVVVLQNAILVNTYMVKNGLKQGVELFYYPHGTTPKLSIEWDAGKINGTVKTWYENGVQESRREMSQNKKQGIFTAWYQNGSVMFVEEYEKDRLVKGSYTKPGEKSPCSRVMNGNGVATFFDSSGNFLQKVTYQDGKPVDSDT